VEEDEGCERLFYYNQFLASTFRQEARAATVGAATRYSGGSVELPRDLNAEYTILISEEIPHYG